MQHAPPHKTRSSRCLRPPSGAAWSPTRNPSSVRFSRVHSLPQVQPSSFLGGASRTTLLQQENDSHSANSDLQVNRAKPDGQNFQTSVVVVARPCQTQCSCTAVITVSISVSGLSRHTVRIALCNSIRASCSGARLLHRIAVEKR